MAQPVVIGRYLLFDAFARGGMASVHLARLSGAAGFARVVAVKRMHVALADDEELRRRFLHEALVVAKLRHPNIVPVLDAVSVGDELLLIMDYVLGVDLHELLRASPGPLEPAVAAGIVAGVLRGLHAAHTTIGGDGAALAIVHRDVKPKNVLVGTEGVSYVADFGIARMPGAMTRSGEVLGSSGYVAPEVLARRPVDARADVWGAAVVLWESLTGQRLFRAESSAAMVAAILEQPIEAPSARASAVPRALDDVVVRGLARDASARFASAAQMADAIESAVETARPARIAAMVEQACGDVVRERRARLREVEAELLGVSPASGVAGEGSSASRDPLPPAQAATLVVTAPETIAATESRSDDPGTAVTPRRSARRAQRARSVSAGLLGLLVLLAVSSAVLIARDGHREVPPALEPETRDAGNAQDGDDAGLAQNGAADTGLHVVDRADAGKSIDNAGPRTRRSPRGRTRKTSPDCTQPFYPDPADPRVMLPKKECLR
ncbi:MAG: hypothetical protein A2138_21265 [Deltaproteobacteria bacterium RBG_16_71_12]|nr:MAG: hypothetical protein A2138_21265 [Deltaproteobacteria bacterium RBG_16_71_12]